MADACWLPKDETLDIWRMRARWSTPWQPGRPHRGWCQNTTAWYAVQVGLSDWPTRYESLDMKLNCQSGQMLQRHADCFSEAGASQSNTLPPEIYVDLTGCGVGAELWWSILGRVSWCRTGSRYPGVQIQSTDLRT